MVWGGRYSQKGTTVIQVGQIIRICLNEDNLKGSTIDAYTLFNVLPIEKLNYKKIAFLFIIKSCDLWVKAYIL